jgi:hypothetical protein
MYHSLISIFIVSFYSWSIFTGLSAVGYTCYSAMRFVFYVNKLIPSKCSLQCVRAVIFRAAVPLGRHIERFVRSVDLLLLHSIRLQVLSRKTTQLS